ncbi:unnamed protein product [Rotaria sp. Silwood1]|nr:unnamed protein product [Rotaria sp. Silwood1]
MVPAMENLNISFDRAHRVVLGTPMEPLEHAPGRILAACLGRLCIHTQKALTLNTMIKPLLEILKVVQQHQDATVKHAVIYAYARSFFSIDETYYDDLITHFIELKCLLDYIIIQDTNTEVQKLTRSVRQI